MVRVVTHPGMCCHCESDVAGTLSRVAVFAQLLYGGGGEGKLVFTLEGRASLHRKQSLLGQ